MNRVDPQAGIALGRRKDECWKRTVRNVTPAAGFAGGVTDEVSPLREENRHLTGACTALIRVVFVDFGRA